MSDQDAEEQKKSRFGRFKRTLPRMPWSRQHTDLGSSWSLARSALRRSRTSCPSCNTGFLKVADAIEHDDRTTSTPLLVCNSCDYTQNISVELGNVAERIADLRIGERRFLISALGAFALGVVYLLVSGNLFTMIGATLIAVLLFANALVFRYRVWQLTFKRLYETRPPFSDWLRYELSGSVTNQD